MIQTSALMFLILNMIKFANSVEVLAKTGFISMQAFQRLCKFFCVKFEYFHKISLDYKKLYKIYKCLQQHLIQSFEKSASADFLDQKYVF